MYAKIIEDITNDPYYSQFPNEGQRFVAWYLRNTHGRDPIQAKDDITDGPDDKGIDAIVIDNDKERVYVVQGKLISEGTLDATPLQEVISSWLQLKDLSALQANANPKLARKLAELAQALEDDNCAIEFELVATATLTPAAQKDFENFHAQLANDDEFPATLHKVDNEELERRYKEAQTKDEPKLSHQIVLEEGKYLSMTIAAAKVVIAAVPLPECLRFPGIKDGILFRKNVRQSLGMNNRVNKGLKNTVYSDDRYRDFFFYHNGITAICDSLDFDATTRTLTLKGLNVVNGCQSLTTLLYCSERVKQQPDSYMMFRFYEIPQLDRADKISINTNSQSTVKPRDLRSNDKRILALKKSYESRYHPKGQFITKRGEDIHGDKDMDFVVDMSDLGKALMAWHCQRPNISYNENKIFDKYFEQIFKSDYSPENVYYLSSWTRAVIAGWNNSNPFGLNESLLALKSYAPFHHLYAIAVMFSIGSNQPNRVPSPKATFEQAVKAATLDRVVMMSAQCLNFALQAAVNQIPPDKVFSPQNWLKAKASLNDINAAISMQLMMLPSMPGGKELKESFSLPAEHFEYRWSAD